MIEYNFIRSLKDINPFFVIIGAMDGVSHDNLAPLVREMKLSGLFVEPVKHMFEKLKENYKEFSNILFENSAITDTNGKADIFRIDFDKKHLYPNWSDGGSSLIPDKTGLKNIQNLVKEEINTITLKELFDKHNINRVDILQIDCEGFDLIVFKQFDFLNFRPYFISIEILSLPNKEINEIYEILNENKYYYYNNGSEILAIKK